MPYTPPSRSLSKAVSTNDDPSETSSVTSGRQVLTPGDSSIDASGQDAFHNFMNHQNASFNNSINSTIASNPQHLQKQSKFYLLDNNNVSSTESVDSFNHSNFHTRNNSTASLMISKMRQNLTLSTLPNNDDDHHQHQQQESIVDDLLKFTTESTQSYSYTPVSSNSLTMRLNVLKRSLEILLENPDWLSSSLESFPDYNTHIDHYHHQQHPPHLKNEISSKLKDFLKMEKSISSSTLQTLLQTAITNDIGDSSSPSASPIGEEDNDSLVNVNPPFFSHNNNKMDNSRSNSINSNFTLSSFNDGIVTELHEMLQLLDDYEKSDMQITTDIQDKFISMHNLSLSNDSNFSRNKRRNLLKVKILHALATPFIDQKSTNNGFDSLPMLKSTTSAIGLSTLSSIGSNKQIHPHSGYRHNSISNNNTAKPLQYHASSNAKTKSPKAVFTVSLNSPWDILNANDLGLLMFGFSKKSLQQMRLMDLIAPRSKDFVNDRLTRTNPLVFSGEIIAVKRENNSLAWTSLWAKRKEHFIILIFEQIACETIDFVTERNKNGNDEPFVREIIKQNHSLYKNTLQGHKLSDFLPSLSAVLHNVKDPAPESEHSIIVQDSNIINRIRYFTLKLENGYFAPCAITSEHLDIPDDDNNGHSKSIVRINLHSLPYMAGTFVISSGNYQIQSFNEAIARNMFGTGDLMNQPFDTIFPNFSKLIELALGENPNMNHQEGLVLPEHYFRKLFAQSKCSKNEDMEEMFLRCRGIDARHNDGNIVKVDIQLHVLSDNLYVIWVTYARSLSNEIHKIQKLMGNKSENDSAISDDDDEDGKSDTILKNNIRFNDNIDVYHFNDERRESTDIPSQLHLLEHHHLDTDSSGLGSAGTTNLSRSSSVKTINEFGISSPVTPKVDSLKFLTKINSESSISPIAADPVMGQDHANDEIDDSKSNLFYMSTMMTCREHLMQEESHVQYLKENSIYFPKVIGAEKRTKKFTDFKILKNLGQGAYGKVVFAQYKKDPLYKDCVKAIFKERILVDTWVRDRTLGTIPSEIQILYALNKFPHANIMRIVDFFEDDNCYYLETLQHGSQGSGAMDLYDIIEMKKDMLETEAKYIYYQVVAALAHMHNHGIVHRDIKDENIIVDKDYFAKLIDFGSAAWVKDGPFGVFVGTIDYAAPEVLNGQPYEGKAQDVWAMGVLLFTLVFKENPFCSVDEILDGEVKFPQYASGSVSPLCLDLIRKILVTDVHQRPTMQQIMDDQWLSGLS